MAITSTIIPTPSAFLPAKQPDSKTLPANTCPQTKAIDIPTVCSQHDTGGGVLYGTSFIIYTVTSSPTLHASSSAALSILASKVVIQIPIHFTISDLSHLHGIPSPTSSPNEIDRLPYFLFNAVNRAKPDHCIAGWGTPVETLLAVLRRPWCILELCCSRDEAVVTLLEFAREAEREVGGYSAAVSLLEHETKARSCEPHLIQPEDATWEMCLDHGKRWEGIRTIGYSTLANLLGGSGNAALLNDLWKYRVESSRRTWAARNASRGDEMMMDERWKQSLVAEESLIKKLDALVSDRKTGGALTDEAEERKIFFTQVYKVVLEELRESEVYFRRG